MARPVEVRATQGLRHVRDRVLGQQHRAEHRLLGGHVLRRTPVAGPPRRLTGLVRRDAIADAERRPIAPLLRPERLLEGVESRLVRLGRGFVGDAHAGGLQGLGSSVQTLGAASDNLAS